MGWKVAVGALFSGVLLTYLSGVFRSPPSGAPEVADGWWGRGEKPDEEEDASVREFKIDVSDGELEDLNGAIMFHYYHYYLVCYAKTIFYFNVFSVYWSSCVKLAE